MKKRLLDFLVCPSCLPACRALKGIDITFVGDDIITGILVCTKCGKRYHIEDGIAYLTPDPLWKPFSQDKYETHLGLSSYLWSHYYDLMGEKPVVNTGGVAYAKWAELIDGERSGICLDIGCAVGRFALEMTQKCDFVVGIDLSVTFIKAARELIREGLIRARVVQEGDIISEQDVCLASTWHASQVEFIVADCLRLPFHENIFHVVTSLNVIDKVSSPRIHLKELSRVAKSKGAQCIVADPFSWSPDVAPRDEWLGGRTEGMFAGYGIDNVRKLMEGVRGIVSPPWHVECQSHRPWIIRNHRNHFEYIISHYVKAKR